MTVINPSRLVGSLRMLRHILHMMLKQLPSEQQAAILTDCRAFRSQQEAQWRAEGSSSATSMGFDITMACTGMDDVLKQFEGGDTR